MSLAWRVCPACGLALSRKTASFTEPFSCPACGEKLRIKQAGFALRSLVIYLFSPLLAWEFGFRGLVFVIISAFAIWPLSFAAKLIVNAIRPPRILVRPHDDPSINRCPKCQTDLENKFELDKPFACP
ncbi:MAG TPA: hypothetical protein VGR72_00805, partial [Candidatus Acidoferrales bacterium]|nr:hypothetical protein [Candidatus Acidoferrales bacterium]